MLVLPLLGCGNPMTPEEKLKMLENQRREIAADLYRQKAECQAQAIEFSGAPEKERVFAGCLGAYRAMVEASQKTLGDLDRRAAEIRLQQQKENPFNQFDGK